MATHSSIPACSYKSWVSGSIVHGKASHTASRFSLIYPVSWYYLNSPTDEAGRLSSSPSRRSMAELAVAPQAASTLG